MADNAELAELIEQMTLLLRRAHALGANEGAIATREAILKAASAPLTFQGSGTVTARVLPSSGIDIDLLPDPEETGRAPRGLARKAIVEALLFDGGISIQEIEDRTTRRYPKLSRKSIGNELRRHEGDLYVRRGKYSWFLKAQAPDETTGSPPNDDPADEPRDSKSAENLF